MVMRLVVTATDRIDYWIRRRIVPCDALLPGNANPSSDRYVGLTTAIGQSLRDQYDALAARVPPHLAALVRQLTTRNSRAEFPGKGTMELTMLRNRYEKNSARCMRLAKENGDSVLSLGFMKMADAWLELAKNRRPKILHEGPRRSSAHTRSRPRNASMRSSTRQPGRTGSRRSRHHRQTRFPSRPTRKIPQHPLKPGLNHGRVQVSARRAFYGGEKVVSTADVVQAAYARKLLIHGRRAHLYRLARAELRLIADPIGRSSKGPGHPILWRLRDDVV
jgi:hypothetical protein